MAELILVLVSALIGLVAALWSLRAMSGRAFAALDFERLAAAVRGATRRFGTLQLLRTAQSALALGVLTFAALLATGSANWLNAAGVALGLLLGAGICAATQSVVALFAVGCTRGVAAAFRRFGANRAAASALHGGVSLAALAEAVALLGGAAIWSLIAFNAPSPQAAWVVGAAIVGAHLAGMLTQVAGASLHAAGRIARRQTPTPYDYQLDARNPGLVLDGTGLQVGAATSRAASTLCTSLLCFAALGFLMPAEAGSAHPGSVLALGLVIRSLILVATCYLSALSRVEDAEGVWRTIESSAWALFLLLSLTTFGAVHWLLSGNSEWILALCTVTGALAGLGLAGRSHQVLLRRSRAARDASELASPGVLPALMPAGAFDAVREALLPLSLALLGVAAAWFVGARIEQASTAIWMYALGFTAITPFLSGVAIALPLCEGASGWLSLSENFGQLDFQSRVSGFFVALQRAARASQTYFLALPGILGLSAALGLAQTGLSEGVAPQTLGASLSLGLVAAVLGVASVLLYCGVVVRHTSDVVRVSLGAPRRDVAPPSSRFAGQRAVAHAAAESQPVATADHEAPRYAEVLDSALAEALRRVPFAVVALLLLPGVLVLGFSWSPLPHPFRTLLAAFLAFATLTGTLLGLLGVGLAALPTWNRRAQPASAENPLGLADAIAHFADCALSPTAQFGVAGLLAVCLALVTALL